MDCFNVNEIFASEPWQFTQETETTFFSCASATLKKAMQNNGIKIFKIHLLIDTLHNDNNYATKNQLKNTKFEHLITNFEKFLLKYFQK